MHTLWLAPALLLATHQKVVVLDLEAPGAPAEVSQSVGVMLPNEVRRAAVGAEVISGADLRSILGFERQKALLTCAKDNCLAELGEALGADEIIAGQLGHLGKRYLLDLRRLDAKRGRVIRAVSRTAPEEQLVEAVRSAVSELFHEPVLEGAAPAEPVASRTPGIILVASGVALGVAGGVALVWSNGVGQAVNRQQALDQPLTTTHAEYRQAAAVNAVGWGALAVGCALAAVGAFQWLPATSAVAVVPLRDGAALAVGGNF